MTSRSPTPIRDSAAAVLGVRDKERLLMILSGRQELFGNRVAWALTHMTQAGLLGRPQRGRYGDAVGRGIETAVAVVGVAERGCL